jgi:hypothetical protein
MPALAVLLWILDKIKMVTLHVVVLILVRPYGMAWNAAHSTWTGLVWNGN